jgi:hypothetical protein
MGMLILLWSLPYAVDVAVFGGCIGLATGILLRPALELIRRMRGRPRIPYSGGWVGLFAGLSLMLGCVGAVVGFIAGLVLYFHGLGGNAGVGFTLYGKDITEAVFQSGRFVAAGVAILEGAIIVRCLFLILDVVRAWRKRGNSAPVDAEKSAAESRKEEHCK